MPDRPVLAETVELTAVDDGYMIFDKTGNRVHYLNPTAAVVALACDGCATAEEIAALVQKHFALSAPPLEDVLEVIRKLRDEALLQPT